MDQTALDESLRDIRTTLEADGFQLQADGDEGRLRVVITATPESCADCIVPEPILQQILQQATGVPAADIDITYPAVS